MQPHVTSWLQTQPPPENQHPVDPLDLSIESADTDTDSMANDDNDDGHIPASSKSHISIDFHEKKAYCHVSISTCKMWSLIQESFTIFYPKYFKNHKNLHLKLAFSMSYNHNFMYFQNEPSANPLRLLVNSRVGGPMLVS